MLPRLCGLFLTLAYVSQARDVCLPETAFHSKSLLQKSWYPLQSSLTSSTAGSKRGKHTLEAQICRVALCRDEHYVDCPASWVTQLWKRLFVTFLFDVWLGGGILRLLLLTGLHCLLVWFFVARVKSSRNCVAHEVYTVRGTDPNGFRVITLDRDVGQHVESIQVSEGCARVIVVDEDSS